MVARAPLYPIHRRLRRTVASAVCAAAAVFVFGAAVAQADLGPTPTLTPDRSCYVVGQPVQLSGSAFAPYRSYVVSIDGVYLGSRTTDGIGNFSVPLHPGGLPAGAAEHYDLVEVTDGTTSAETNFTLTRRAGFRIANLTGATRTLTGRFVVWGFSLTGVSKPLYLHYLNPSGKLRKTVWLGTTGGACGYLRTVVRRIFPFTVSAGTWTLQVDTQQLYSRQAPGPRVRIRVVIS
ncbi:MAG: hypothetical protein E6G05_12920 [Actinobacteria bacterium]|nr:MAG: hypothetical protein E6G05_12920 [Actinomycetota bacterium]